MTKFFIPVNEKAFSVNFFEIFSKSLMRCLSMNVYVYVYVGEYVHAFVCVCVDEEISRCPTHSNMYIYIHICVFAYMREIMCICVQAHIRIHTYIYIYYNLSFVRTCTLSHRMHCCTHWALQFLECLLRKSLLSGLSSLNWMKTWKASWSVHICVYIIHVYIYIYMFIYIYILICACTHMHIISLMYTHTHMYVYIHIWMCWTSTNFFIYTYTYEYMYIFTNIHIHINIHTQTAHQRFWEDFKKIDRKCLFIHWYEEFCRVALLRMYILVDIQAILSRYVLFWIYKVSCGLIGMETFETLNVKQLVILRSHAWVQRDIDSTGFYIIYIYI